MLWKSGVFGVFNKGFKVSVGDEVDVIYAKGYQDKVVLMDILVVSENMIRINNK